MFEYIEAEESLISCLMMRGDALEDIYGVLSAEMFESGALGRAFMEYSKAFDEKRELTIEELMQRMSAAGFENYEINDVITRCAGKSAMAYQIKSYASVIQNHYKKRQIDKILGSTEIKDAEIDEQIDKIIGDLDSLRSGRVSEGHTVADITREHSERYFKDRDDTLILLNEDGIDSLTGGFQGGDLIILGARPSVGKSALAAQWAWEFARQGLTVGYYNCEMQEAALLERFIASKTGISITRIRLAKAFLNDEEQRYRKAVDELSKQDKIIIFTGAKTVSDIRKDMRHYKFDIIIIDYLQLLIVDNRYKGNRVAEVAELSQSIKSLAMDFNIPIIALSQLSRASESRQTKEPQLSDLRESGSLEQDASIVFFLWDKDETDRSQKGFKTSKSRNGLVDRYDLLFDGATMSFKAESKATPFD